MPELKDMSRDSWEDADVDVGSTPVFKPVDCLILPLSTVGYVRVFR